MNCPNCNGSTWDTYTGANANHTGGISILCVGSIDCRFVIHMTREQLIGAVVKEGTPEAGSVLLPRSCPDCGAGIVIGQKIAVCEANKYSSSLGAGDCRWSLTLTPDLRRQADEALAAQVAA